MIPALAFAAVFLVLWALTYAVLPAVVRGVRALAAGLARWLRAQARFAPWFSRVEAQRSWLPLVLAFAAGTAVIFVAADAFTDIAKALKNESPSVRRLDDGVWTWFRSRRTPASTVFFTGVTEVGGVAGMSLIVLAVLALLLVERRFRWAGYLALTAAGGSALNQLLKFHYVRQRPDLEAAVLGALGYSFPSGHAMTGTVVLGALAYLAARTAHTWRLKSAAFAGLATLALAIGISRLYLGVHWASDVAGGFAAGALWVAATTTAYEVFRQYRLSRAGAATPSAAIV